MFWLSLLAIGFIVVIGIDFTMSVFERARRRHNLKITGHALARLIGYPTRHTSRQIVLVT